MGSLIQAVNEYGSLFYGVILGIFLVAFYMKPIRGTAVFIAAVAGEVIVVLLYVLDKTGAGDAYTAGLLAGIIGQLGGPGPDDLRERLRALTIDQMKRACLRGNHLGARACTALGATTAVPRRSADAPV